MIFTLLHFPPITAPFARSPKPSPVPSPRVRARRSTFNQLRRPSSTTSTDRLMHVTFALLRSAARESVHALHLCSVPFRSERPPLCSPLLRPGLLT
jgi:hypothetical protein